MATVQAIRPLVSIVIPCFRQSHLLADAIESASAQTYPRVEIVVVDDGSPDDVPSVVARSPSVTLIRQANRGVAAARKLGVTLGGRHTTGQSCSRLWALGLVPGTWRRVTSDE